MRALKTPKVSIIIPCYNAERWCAQTLGSALSQTWPNIQIIVVDDGSTDKSLSIVSSFEDRGIKVIHQQNRGGGAARNRGLQEAQGEYIQYLDADDLLEPDKIERQMETLAGRQDCAVTAKWGRFERSTDAIAMALDPLYRDLQPLDWAVSVLNGHGMMPIHGWLTPRQIIEQAGPWNEELIRDQDGEYFFRIALASREVLYCPTALCYYRSGLPGSVSHSTSAKAWTSAFKACELRAEVLLQAEDSTRTRRASANAFQRFAYYAYPQMPDLVMQAEQRVKDLGGASVDLGDTPLSKCLSKLLPWKIAKRTHMILRPNNYS